MAQYIDKSALVAEIKKLKGKISDGSSYCNGWQHALRMLELELKTLEVKEVDLEKEIEEVKHNYKVDDNRHTSICSADIEWLAEHFFELGTKATQKGE